MQPEIDSLLDYWFGPLDERGLCLETRNPLWFQRRQDTDDFCRENYETLLERARRGELDDWQDTDRGLVALVVLMDQFSRNIHRDTPGAFAADAAALRVAQQAIDEGRDLRLPAVHRAFLYMPLEHSEDIAVQVQCVERFGQLADEVPDEQITSFARYAQAHYDVIARFGRFPHRNAILGRKSTPEELAYLQKHGGF